jgi:Flp pilus assembly protein protease CpaA
LLVIQSHIECELGGSPTQTDFNPTEADRTGANAGAAVVQRRSAKSDEVDSHVRRDVSVLVLTVVAAIAGGLVSGRAVGVTLGAVGGVALTAAVVDVRTRRIPNLVALVVLGCLLVGIVLVVVFDHRSAADVTGSALVAWFLSGAPFVLAMWLLRPAVVGGGDLKLLSLLACTAGLLAPYAACLILLTAMVVALGQALARRALHVVLGPGLALGYAVALTAGVAANEVLGGRYS